MIALGKLVRMTLVVNAEETAVLEQHLAANRVIRSPFFITAGALRRYAVVSVIGVCLTVWR
jgi:hypothetical protein